MARSGGDRERVSADHSARSLPHQRGFSLTELMVSVALVSILASIAIPSFVRFNLKSKRSEAFFQLKSLAIAEVSYEIANGKYVACSASPTTGLDKNKHPFNPKLSGWSELTWLPDGDVYCHYGTQLFTNTKGEWVRAFANCDLDDDNVTAVWWMDVDPRGTSPSSQHMVLRPSNATASSNVY